MRTWVVPECASNLTLAWPSAHL